MVNQTTHVGDRPHRNAAQRNGKSTHLDFGVEGNKVEMKASVALPKPEPHYNQNAHPHTREKDKRVAFWLGRLCIEERNR
jgi:hypothetical protein